MTDAGRVAQVPALVHARTCPHCSAHSHVWTWQALLAAVVAIGLFRASFLGVHPPRGGGGAPIACARLSTPPDTFVHNHLAKGPGCPCLQPRPARPPSLHSIGQRIVHLGTHVHCWQCVIGVSRSASVCAQFWAAELLDALRVGLLPAVFIAALQSSCPCMASP